MGDIRDLKLYLPKYRFNIYTQNTRTMPTALWWEGVKKMGQLNKILQNTIQIF